MPTGTVGGPRLGRYLGRMTIVGDEVTCDAEDCMWTATLPSGIPSDQQGHLGLPGWRTQIKHFGPRHPRLHLDMGTPDVG